MKYIVRYILKILAQRLLKKHNPKIVAITGSVGKTTTKDAIFHVLDNSEDLKVLRNTGNFNNEFGLPLTILEQKPGKNTIDWIVVVLKSIWKLITSKDYYDILVLEMASDGPGNIVYLCQIAQPDIAIVMNVERVHLLNFKSLDELAHEKSTLIHMSRKDGMVIVNYDNFYTKNMIKIAGDRKVYTFGIDKEADIRAGGAKDTKQGLNFNVIYREDTTVIKMPHVIGKHNVYTILPIFPVADFFGIDMKKTSKSLQTFHLPQGRMNLVEGQNKSYIIDSTYNAEPSSMKAAIHTLKDFPEGKRRIAVVGDMLELGYLEEKSHREIGRLLMEARIDLVFFVGPKMKWAMDEMENHARDYARMLFHFKDSFVAAREIALKIKEEDIVLVKGSRGMMMERVVHRLRKG